MACRCRARFYAKEKKNANQIRLCYNEQRVRRKILLLLLMIGVVGCSAAPTTTPSPVPLASIAATPAATRPVATPTLSPSGTITLTLWTTEEFAPNASPPGSIWRDQLAAFQAANPNIALDVVLKKPDGKGGLLDALVATSAVAPALMPDAAILNASDVQAAAEKKILQRLDAVARGLADDRFPFANQYATYQNQWFAVPFAADVQHLVYNQAAVSAVPRTWDDLSRQKTTLLLPLSGDDAFLLQYLSFGASLDNFDTLTATQVFAFIKRSRDMGLLPEAALNAKSTDEAWDAFAAGEVGMAQVRAGRYLADQGLLPTKLNSAFAPVPTRDGRPMTLASAWAFAIVTNNPARQNAAAAWISWMMQPERLAPYLRASHRLPATRAVLGAVVTQRDYAVFLRDLMESAIPMPSIGQNSKKAEGWRADSAAVWRGQMTPDEAARNIASAGR
jgi:ABC-type glycerol-3-phosphate transport system substrate-binding protein